MSQEKVDKYKKEKKNREKKLRKKRAKNYILVLLGFALLGGAIGYPMGRFIYRQNYSRRQESARVTAIQYDYWFQKYWDANISSELQYPDEDIASDTDAISM